MSLLRLGDEVSSLAFQKMMASAPPGVRTVPSIETADGFKILISWPATVTIGKEDTGSAFEFLRSEATSSLAVGSTCPNTLIMSAPIPEVLFFPPLLPARDIAVSFSFECGPS